MVDKRRVCEVLGSGVISVGEVAVDILSVTPGCGITLFCLSTKAAEVVSAQCVLE